MNTPYVTLAYMLGNLTRDWDRQDRELADARSGLAPEDRVNEAAENARIMARRNETVKKMVETFLEKSSNRA